MDEKWSPGLHWRSLKKARTHVHAHSCMHTCTHMHTYTKTHMQAHTHKSREAKDNTLDKEMKSIDKRQEVRQTDLRKTKHTRKETLC